MTPSWAYNPQAFTVSRTACQLAVIGFVSTVHKFVLQLCAGLLKELAEELPVLMKAMTATRQPVRQESSGLGHMGYHLILKCPEVPTDSSTASCDTWTSMQHACSPGVQRHLTVQRITLAVTQLAVMSFVYTGLVRMPLPFALSCVSSCQLGGHLTFSQRHALSALRYRSVVSVLRCELDGSSINESGSFARPASVIYIYICAALTSSEGCILQDSACTVCCLDSLSAGSHQLDQPCAWA